MNRLKKEVISMPMNIVGSNLSSFLSGPLGKILEHYIDDSHKKENLTSEIERAFLSHLSNIARAQSDIIRSEVNSESWMARNWRPSLMFVMIGFILVLGFFLPMLDALVGYPIKFEPRWRSIPPELWEFLTIGMGGYIGGRSLEKIALQMFGKRLS